MTSIYDSDLLNKKYDTQTLIKNIKNLNKKIILNTQKLTPEFCIQYIFEIDNIDDGDEDSYLFDFEHILQCQTHIKEEDLMKAYNDIYK